jgi:hypothetical protein
MNRLYFGDNVESPGSETAHLALRLSWSPGRGDGRVR